MKQKTQPNPLKITLAGEKGGEIILSPVGRIETESLHTFLEEATTLVNQMNPRKLIVDLSKVGYLDSAGALGLIHLEEMMKSRSVAFQLIHATHEARRILDLVDREALAATPLAGEATPENVFEEIGQVCLKICNDFVALMTFLADLLGGLLYSFLHPRSVRWEDLLFYMWRTGVEGLPIVGLLSFLLGLIIAFMSSLQLKQFGANIYVASLVGVAMVTELGPLMTAIIVAGRSGSAFAAEIGTMKVNEEVDALITMGFDPIRFLAIPKVLAAVLVVPLLTLYSDLFGIAGGMVVGVLGLDLTVNSYLQATMKVITVAMILKSLIKSVFFAALIAGIGCQRGFQVRGGAEEVGSATTSAVVAGIFVIVLTDSAFAILYSYVWKEVYTF
jgi:phospholipid/cholesterol/gamma-HCH transport system permease protein